MEKEREMKEKEEKMDMQLLRRYTDPKTGRYIDIDSS